jgi:hypothetical protein
MPVIRLLKTDSETWCKISKNLFENGFEQVLDQASKQIGDRLKEASNDG